MDFKDQVVVVTGSSRGIGASTVKAFAKHGAKVVINYVKEKEQAEKVRDEIISLYGTAVLVVQADVSKEEDVNRLVEEVLNTFGHIDVLVNNAGIAIDTLFSEKTKENFMRTLEVNLVGAFLMSKKVGEIMMNQKKGCIIQVSSTNGIDTVYPESIDYDASKAGLISLTKNLSRAFAPYVRVNTICPGWVDTDMNQSLDFSFKQNEIDHISLGRFARPEEIASTILFLASEEASYINGTFLRVDGGVK